MMRLESLIELKFLNSNFSSSNSSIRCFRARPLIAIGQTSIYRAIRGNSISVNSTLPPLSSTPSANFVSILLLLLLSLLLLLLSLLLLLYIYISHMCIYIYIHIQSCAVPTEVSKDISRSFRESRENVMYN